MIKARGIDGDGRPLLILGLSFSNLRRLQAGDPIRFDGVPYGFAGTIHIMAGRDEATIASLFRAANPRMKITKEDKAP